MHLADFLVSVILACCLVSSVESVDCDPVNLWNLPAPDAVFTQDSAPDPNCNANAGGSAMLLNTTLNTTTLACYSGTTPGSVASFFCNGVYELNTTTIERECVMAGNNATWTGNPVTCVCRSPSLERRQYVLIGVGIFDFLLTAALIAWEIVVLCGKTGITNKVEWLRKLTIACVVTCVVLCVVGAIFWFAFGGVVSEPPNNNFCDAGWRNTRDALLGTGFALFLLALLIITILNIIAAFVGCYASKDSKVYTDEGLTEKLPIHYDSDPV